MKMNNYLRDLPFERLCYEAQLGKAIGHPEPISGGLLHRMYAITTTEGKYAVKVLNPQFSNEKKLILFIAEKWVLFLAVSIKQIFQVWI
ncbi:hypothetical protein Q7A53_08690 [Halobacillus rhizosphaerae]|uniref:hypothetical protein n=1 Tax=Halobacillus rhizosphaerae TaxID=3064889 RepID=UPI00398A6446